MASESVYLSPQHIYKYTNPIDLKLNCSVTSMVVFVKKKIKNPKILFTTTKIARRSP